MRKRRRKVKRIDKIKDGKPFFVGVSECFGLCAVGERGDKNCLR